jgi:hypothetical protein
VSPVVSPAVSPVVTAPSPSPSPVTGVLTSLAGRVAVTCLGTTLTAWSIEADDGWSIEARRLSAREVEIEMADGSDDVVDVLATCQDEGPVFTDR